MNYISVVVYAFLHYSNFPVGGTNEHSWSEKTHKAIPTNLWNIYICSDFFFYGNYLPNSDVFQISFCHDLTDESSGLFSKTISYFFTAEVISTLIFPNASNSRLGVTKVSIFLWKCRSDRSRGLAEGNRQLMSLSSQPVLKQCNSLLFLVPWWDMKLVQSSVIMAVSLAPKESRHRVLE